VVAVLGDVSQLVEGSASLSVLVMSSLSQVRWQHSALT